MNKQAILEGLLFVVGDDGLTLKQIEDILEVDTETANRLVMDLMKIYEEAQLHQKQYDNLVRQNTIKGQEIAKKYIGEMNKALAKDLGYSDISRGADYLTEHGGGWDHIYISNMAWFDQKF